MPIDKNLTLEIGGIRIRIGSPGDQPVLETFSDHDGGWRLEAQGDAVDETIRTLLEFLEKYERPRR